MKFLLGFLMTTTLFSINAIASDLTKLPLPQKEGNTTLIQALENRQSIKEFADKEIDNQTLSNILWAAYGVNRANGNRVIPTAMNQKDLSVYVFNKDGIFLYNADENGLHPISGEDHRSLFATQDYMTTVPVVLVYTGSNEDYAVMHAGSAYQNVGLYAAAYGLANVVRGYFDKETVAKALNLPKGQRVIISQAIGFRK